MFPGGPERDQVTWNRLRAFYDERTNLSLTLKKRFMSKFTCWKAKQTYER